ncbi:MAG: sulfotransferase domain-containing protein [Planctomycetota bacterium]
MGYRLSAPRVRFVIFASAKSGTQWMQQLLGAHPQVHCAETRAFGEHFDPDNPSAVYITLDTYCSILSRYHRKPPGIGGAHDAQAYFRGLSFNLLDTIAETSLRAAGKSIYGEKITPLPGTADEVVERLAAYNPELRFVHLTRDGRDVIVSGLAGQRIVHRGSAKGDRLERAIAERRVTQEMLEFFTALWTQAVGAGLGAKNVFAHYLQLRYEDVLEDPLAQVRRLLEFVGADAADATCEGCVRAASFEAMSGGRRRGQEDLDSVVRKGVAGDWCRWITDEQAAWFDARAGELMDALGYGRPSENLRPRPVRGG